MKTNLKRIGAWALCFMLLLSCIPVSADDGTVQTRDYSVGYSLDSATWAVSDENAAITYSSNSWTIPVFYYDNNARKLVDQSSIEVGNTEQYTLSKEAPIGVPGTITKITAKSTSNEEELANGANGESEVTISSTRNYSTYTLTASGNSNSNVTLSTSYRYNNNVNNRYTQIWVYYNPASMTASFVLNGGKTASGSDSIEEIIAASETGYSVTMPDEPVREGYTFRGWLSSADNTLYSAGVEVTLSDDTMFTAQWAQYIYVEPKTLTIGIDLSEKLKATLTDAANPNAQIEWSVDDSNIVSVDNDGNVTALALGTTTVTATYTDGDVVETATCVVTVVATAALFLDYSTVTLVQGSTSYGSFDITALYSGAKDSPVFTWECSDTSVVTLTEGEVNGKSQTVTLTAQSEGTAVITVSTEGLLQQCTVTVAASNAATNDCYFYVLRPEIDLTDTSVEKDDKWYYTGKGTVNAAPSDASDTKYTDLNVLSWPTIPSGNLPSTITYKGKTYAYASSGAVAGTYTIEWMYRIASWGATNGSGTNLVNGVAWHIDGRMIFHDPDLVDIAYKVKQPGAEVFSLVFVEGDDKAPSDKYYPQVVEVNTEHTVEQVLSSKTYNNETYLFDGWYTDEACTQKVESGAAMLIAKDTTFYGKYVRVMNSGDITFKKIVQEPEFTSGTTSFSFTLTAGSGVNSSDFAKWKAENARLFNSDGQIVVTLAGNSNGISTSEIVALSDLPLGTYTLAEVSPTTDAKEYTTTYQIDSDAAVTGLSAQITVEKDRLINVTFTNTFVPKTADLTITKNVANLPAGNLNDDTFTFTVKDSAGNVVDTSTALQHDGSYTFEGLEAGTYTVTESVASAKAGGTAHSYEMTAAEDQKEITVTNNSFEITIVAGVDRSVTVTNTCNDTVDLTVKKVWEDEGFYYESETDPETGDDYEGFLRPSSVEMTLNVPDGVTLPTGVTAKATLRADEYGEWSHTWSGVPKYKDGAKIVYSVTEEPVSGYTAVKSTESFNENGEATITNAIDLGYIRLTKTFTDRRAVADLDDLAFTIAVKDSYGIDWGSVINMIEESGSSSGTHTEIPYPIPVGTYTVTEISNENTKSLDAYNVSHRIGTEGEFVTGASAGTITVSKANTESDPVEIQFNNTLKTYSLIVKKQIAGNMADSQKDFTFTAKLLKPQPGVGDSGEEVLTYVDSGLNFTNDGLTASGTGVTFTLKANESITLTGIPYGYEVVVTEQPVSGYSVSTSQDGGSTWSTPAGGSDTVGPFTYDANVHPELIFKNTNNATIDTGVTLDFLPYVLLILGVGVVVALWLVMSAKKRKDD